VETKRGPGSLRRGNVTVDESTIQVHVGRVVSAVDCGAVRSRRFRVVLDSVNGAGGPSGKALLAVLGCDVVAINDRPTGRFSRGPEPLAANLGDLCRRVKAEGADAGFAQDPDADRLAIVDERGRCIGEEYTLALAATNVFRKTPGSAAANLSTSRMIDDVAARFGGSVIRTPVGEANVVAAMIEHGCVIGGEGNGGVIDPTVGYVRDSLVGMAVVVELMAATGKTVSALAEGIGGYFMIKDKFAAGREEAGRLIELAEKSFAGAEINRDDGLRLDFSDGWLSIRPSNTEPVARVIVEAASENAAKEYLGRVLDMRRTIAGD